MPFSSLTPFKSEFDAIPKKGFESKRDKLVRKLFDGGI